MLEGIGQRLSGGQFSSVIQSCPTLCKPMDCSMPGFIVHHQLLELAQTYVHRVSDAIQSSHPLLSLLLLTSVFPSIRVFSSESVLRVSDAIQSSHPLLSLLLLTSIFPSIQVFSSESVLRIKWPKYWSFSLSISPSNEYSGLISFRIDYLMSSQSKRLSRSFSNTTVRKHLFFGAQSSLWSSSHIHT